MSRADLIQTYFAACNAGNSTAIAACFTPDAVIYDVNLEPVVSAEAIGRKWPTVRRLWGFAEWTVVSTLEQGDHAACEWSMRGIALRGGNPFTFRGSDHYCFRGDLIAQVRQYWTSDPNRLDTGLIGYPIPTQ